MTKMYKTEYLLNMKSAIDSVSDKIDTYNAITAYLLGRNARKLDAIVKKFEEDRAAILKDSWFKEFSEMEDQEAAKEKFKVELDEAEKEIKELLEAEVDFTFYHRKIEEVNFNGRDVVLFMDLIKED